MGEIGLNHLFPDRDTKAEAEKLLRLLSERKRLGWQEMAEATGSSTDAVMAMVELLGEKELLVPVKSGAVRINQVRKRFLKGEFAQDQKHFSPEETAIAREARRLIRPGDTIYLHAGNSGIALARMLDDPELPITLVTHSVVLANEVMCFQNVSVFVTGGSLQTGRGKGHMTDAYSSQRIREMAFDIAFVSCMGLSAAWGATINTSETRELHRATLASARRKVMMLPSARLGTRTFVKICDADAYDVIITDADAWPKEAERLAAKGAEVILAEPEICDIPEAVSF